MKKADVEIGSRYKAKVSNKIVTVEILAESPYGGWDAKNLSTGKAVRIKSARRLRGFAAKPNTVAPVAQKQPESSQPAAEPKSTHTGKPVPPEANVKPLSLLKAAAMVLEACGRPLGCKEMIDKAVDAGIWKPGSGRTPANTLHAAISKEIKTKGANSRFEKVGRGQFALAQ